VRALGLDLRAALSTRWRGRKVSRTPVVTELLEEVRAVFERRFWLPGLLVVIQPLDQHFRLPIYSPFVQNTLYFEEFFHPSGTHLRRVRTHLRRGGTHLGRGGALPLLEH
jgi:hypothetical protein